MTLSRELPPAEKTAVNLGFLKLTDSAPLVMAQEMGFFDQYGLDVTLTREVSWASVSVCSLSIFHATIGLTYIIL